MTRTEGGTVPDKNLVTICVGADLEVLHLCKAGKYGEVLAWLPSDLPSDIFQNVTHIPFSPLVKNLKILLNRLAGWG